MIAFIVLLRMVASVWLCVQGAASRCMVAAVRALLQHFVSEFRAEMDREAASHPATVTVEAASDAMAHVAVADAEPASFSQPAGTLPTLPALPAPADAAAPSSDAASTGVEPSATIESALSVPVSDAATGSDDSAVSSKPMW
jgi:hypothetical protein